MQWLHRLLDLSHEERVCYAQITSFEWILYGSLELVLPHRNGQKCWKGLEWEFKYGSEYLFRLGDGNLPKKCRRGHLVVSITR